MLDQALAALEVSANLDLDVMRPDQGLAGLTAVLLQGVDRVLSAEAPDVVVVQGDTTTTFATALAAFYRDVPVAHVEAGLRTGNPRSPFPEEVNRRLTSTLATLHLAPTAKAAANLRAEGIPEARIRVTGNTVIDALQQTVARLDADPALAREAASAFGFLRPDADLVLVTAHRRESFGRGFEDICDALSRLARAHPGADLVYPVHLNPNVRAPVFARLQGLDNVHLVEPTAYLPFVWLLRRARLVLTDSGGIQEEAPALGRPVLVMRETTERPEAVEAGTARLVGTDPDRIVAEAGRLLTDDEAWAAMSRAHNPFGDGRAAERIADALEGLAS